MLITFEGIDGCGKSTQIEYLKNYLDRKQYKYAIFREPGGTDISEKIRSLLLHETEEMNPVTELLLFSAARSQLIIEKVKPLLAQNDIVILDRFYDSTTAYQGFGRELSDRDVLKILNSLASHDTVPDFTFYLRITPAEASKRTKGSSKDRMENSGDSFFQKVVEGYDYLAKTEDRFYIIDALQPAHQIHSEVVNIIENHL